MSQALSREMTSFLGAHAFGAVVGNTARAATRKARADLARSETLRVHGNILLGNREILWPSAGGSADRDGKPKGVSRR